MIVEYRRGGICLEEFLWNILNGIDADDDSLDYDNGSCFAVNACLGKANS